MSNNSWILAIVGSTTAWALADLILDVTIGEEAEHGAGATSSPTEPTKLSATTTTTTTTTTDGTKLSKDVDLGVDDPEETTASATNETVAMLSKRRIATSAAASTTATAGAKRPSTPTPPSTAPFHTADDNDHHHHQDAAPTAAAAAGGLKTHMTGDQDTAVSGLVTLLIVYAMCYQRWVSHRALALEFDERRAKGLAVGSSSGVGGVWSPLQDVEWWVAAFGGFLLFVHYMTLYEAYDTAPSTVINPLLQVSSTWVLLGSAIPAAISGETFIQPFDLFCYCIIVVGGLLPSIQGDLWGMLRPAFWRQSFVKNAVLSELSLGLYDLLLVHVLKAGKLELAAQAKEEEVVMEVAAGAGAGAAAAPTSEIQKAGPNVLENEFFFIAWCWFAVSFAFAFALHPRLQEEYAGLKRIPYRILFLAGLGQVFMFVGYYSSQFGYSWFYQASVVHAAEASMAQGFNLVLAFVAKRFFNLGRDSAVLGLKYKVASVVVVSIGLFLIAFQDLARGGDGSHGGPGRRLTPVSASASASASARWSWVRS